MGSISVETLAAAKTYVNESLEGVGAIAGKPCQIKSNTAITGGHRITFLWVDNSDVEHTTTLDVMDGEKGDTGLGVKSLSINASNHLIVTYDDDTTEDAGEITNITTDFSHISDIDINNVEDGQVLKYNGTTHKWENASAGSVDTNLEDLNDVDFTTLTDGQIIVWDATAHKWKNADNSPTITVDNALSDSSENPVQNKVVKAAVDAKQDAESGKGLSENDYTDADKAIVDGVTAALADKVDKVANKGLSTNDYDNTAKAAVDALGTASTKNVAASGNASASEVVMGNDTRLSDTRDPKAHTHTLSDITDAGTAAAKDATTYVNPDNNDIPTSNAVYQAMTSMLEGAFHPSGNKTCAELTSALLIQENVGNVYDITDDGVTTADWVGGAGQTIEAGQMAVVVYGNEPNTFLFNLRNGIDIDLSDYQTKAISPITVDGQSKANVEDALGAINTLAGSNKTAISGIKDGTDIDSFGDVETALGNKQDTISDLSTIRSGAAAGATAVQPSDTAGLLKNDGTIDTSTYATTSQLPDITVKADKVTSAVNGNFAGLDSNGNLTDSGKKAADFQPVIPEAFTGDLNTLSARGFHQYTAAYADLSNAPTVSYTVNKCYIDVWSDGAGNVCQIIKLVGLTYDPAAKYCDIFKRSCYSTGSALSWGAWEKQNGKADKVTSATAGNLAGLDANGNLTDSSISPASVASKSATVLTSSNDLNNVTTPGFYYTANTDNPSHIPSGTNLNNNIIEVIKQGSVSRCVQLFYSINAQKMWFRIGNSVTDPTSWSSWEQIAFGSLATKADLITSPTADNLVAMDANGNIKDSGKSVSGLATDTQDRIKETVGWTGRNLYNKATGKANTVVSQNGESTSSTYSNFNASDYIEVEANTSYYLQNGCGNTTQNTACVYDSSKTFLRYAQLSGSQAQSGVISTGANAKYIRLNVLASYVDTCMLSKGSDTNVTYEPYHKSVEEEIKQIHADNGVLGAKNLLQNTATSQTINNVAFTVNSDDKTVNVTRTAEQTEIATRDLYVVSDEDYKLLAGKTLLMTGCPSGGSGDTYYLECYYNDGTGHWLRDIGDGLTITLPATKPTTIKFLIGVKVPSVIPSDGLTFKPMIRLASDPDNTYQPYAMTNRELTEIKTLTPTITSSAYTMTYQSVKRCGNIVQVWIRLKLSNSISAGGNADGTVSGIPFPIGDIMNLAYNSANVIGILFQTNGTLRIRAFSTLDADTDVDATFTYIAKQ